MKETEKDRVREKSAVERRIEEIGREVRKQSENAKRVKRG